MKPCATKGMLRVVCYVGSVASNDASDIDELMKSYDRLAGYSPDAREVPQNSLFCGPVAEDQKPWWNLAISNNKQGFGEKCNSKI